MGCESMPCGPTRALAGVALGLLLTHPTATFAGPGAGAVELRLRAFIPDPASAGAATGYIVDRPGHSGESLVRLLPSDKVPNVLTPACFITDGRGFSPEQAASSRSETSFLLTPAAAGATVLPAAARTRASRTYSINCQSGADIENASGSVSRDDIGTPAYADGVYQVIGQASAKNVLAAWGWGPTIDYSFDAKWSPWSGKLTVKASYGPFPAFEVYARADDGKWVTVMRAKPSGSPWMLMGDPFGNLTSDTQSVTLPSMAGTWSSMDSDHRFQLVIQGETWQLLERSSSNSILTKTVGKALKDGGTMRISRENSDDVLAFLGYQQTLRNEIKARSPQSSYIDLRWDNGELVGDWFGLLVTKDEKAHLKDLFQPGTRPSKQFKFAHSN